MRYDRVMVINTSGAEDDRIYIDELAKLVNRQVGTIRRWEADGRLPKHLLPRRGARSRRYWTHTQVHGARGIIAWMKRNDMRPGNLLTDPAKEAEHIANLRQPKLLSGHHIKSAKTFVENGKSREWIIKKIFPRTKYARPQNLEAALVRVFERNGWEFPAPKPKPPKPKLSKRALKEIEQLERRIEQLVDN